MGEGLLSEPPAAMAAASDEAPVPVAARRAEPRRVGWVAVLADCLHEQRPGDFVVVDRAVTGQRPREVAGDVMLLRELGPSLVIVGVASPYLAVSGAPREELDALIAALRVDDGPEVIVVGPLPPVMGPVVQPTRGFAEGVHHVDPVVAWVASTDAVGPAVGEQRLTDQGHARIAAPVCDAVLAWASPSVE